MGYTRPQAVVLYILLLTPYTHSCLYFNGSDLSEQMLVIDRDRMEYCVLNATTKVGEVVYCKGSVTAIRINNTHVLLNTEERLENTTFLMSYGTNKTGDYAFPYEGDCPKNSTPVTEKTTSKSVRMGYERYGLYAAICLVLVISFVIYMKCKKDQSQRNGGSAICNGVSGVKYTNGIHVVDTDHVEQNGASSH